MPKLAALLALALAAAALAACGDDNGTTTTEAGEEPANGAATGEAAGGAKGSTVSLETDPGGSFAYTSEEATAQAGAVTLDLENSQAIPHDVAIEGPDGEEIGKTDVITESSTTARVDLKPGEYTFYCTVPGHREAGMEGTLTVR